MITINLAQKETPTAVELSYQTRGTQKTLHITADSIVVSINGEKQNFQTTPAQWKAITLELKKLNLKSIANLKRPTTKAFYDGAFAAQLKVITSLKTYESTGFDSGTPPKALVKLIKSMTATLAGGKSKNEF